MIGACTFANDSEASTFTMGKMMEAMAQARAVMSQPCAPSIRIITNQLLTETLQTKYPKKRKNRRWVKKYSKKYTITVPKKDGYFFKDQGVFVCHPASKLAVDASMIGREYESVVMENAYGAFRGECDFFYTPKTKVAPF